MAEEKNALIPVEQKEVVFYDDEIIAVQVEDGTVYVPLRPICKSLGVAWRAQNLRIQRDPVLSDVVRSGIVTIPEVGKRTMICLPLEYLNGFLFGINATRVKEEIREKLIQYQRECYQILASAFLAQPTPDDWGQTSPETMLALQQIRENALAMARLAEEQMWMMTRLDKAAVIVGQHGKRITALEQKLAPRETISDEQAADVSAMVMAIATEMSALDPSKNHYQSIFAELHRRFRVTSYKNIRQSQYQNVLDFLDTYSGMA
jgi:P22_AR N-terminal domain/ORF6C domain